MPLGIGNLVVLVCGSRTYSNPSPIRRQLEMLPEGTWIVHGDCNGVDRLAERVAVSLNLPCFAEPADWPRYGGAAGPIRNQRMLDKYDVDGVIAFHDKQRLEDSRGTNDMVTRAKQAVIPVRIIGRDVPLREQLEADRVPFHVAIQGQRTALSSGHAQ